MILNDFLSPTLINFLGEIEDLGFSLCLVGGGVRDFLLTGSIGHDLDFEIRSQQKISDFGWPVYYDKLFQFLKSRVGNVVTHPYMITKVDFEGHSLEFSSPRLEYYEVNHNHSHHNFKAQLSSNITYLESFKRRDFTINAMGFELSFKKNTYVFIDPYNGDANLKEKKLKFIDQNFFKDSVRFLRMIRFSIKYQLSIDSELKGSLAEFNLSDLSKYHFISEMFKTETGLFLNLFKNLVLEYKIIIPPIFKIWIELDLLWPEKKLQTKDDILVYIYLTNNAMADNVRQFFSMPDKDLKSLSEVVNAIKLLHQLNHVKAKEILNLEPKLLSENIFLKSLKILNDKKKWRELIKVFNPHLEEGVIFKLNYLDIIILTNDEVMNCEKSLRSSLKYLKALKKWVDE